MAGWARSKGSRLYVGAKVGYLTLRGRVRVGKNTPAYRKKSWRVECVCGKLLTVPEYYLVREVPKTHCGCKTATLKSKYNSEYRIWCMMRQRCYFPHHEAYKYYGGRGIQIHPTWLGEEGFKNFLEYIGPRPKPYHLWSVDRIDVNGNYEPGNVRWADSKTQAANTRTAIARREKAEQDAALEVEKYDESTNTSKS